MVIRRRVQRYATAQYPRELHRSITVRDVTDDVKVPSNNRMRSQSEEERDGCECEQKQQSGGKSSRGDYSFESTSRRKGRPCASDAACEEARKRSRLRHRCVACASRALRHASTCAARVPIRAKVCRARDPLEYCQKRAYVEYSTASQYLLGFSDLRRRNCGRLGFRV